MVSRNLVICDQEVRYAAALAEVFMKAKELALGVQVCNSVEQTVKLQEESPVDILLIGSSYPVEDRKKIKAGNVFVLAQSENAAHETNEKLINKYQSGEAIMGAVIEQCTQSGIRKMSPDPSIYFKIQVQYIVRPCQFFSQL